MKQGKAVIITLKNTALSFIIRPYRVVRFKALNSATDNAATCRKNRPVTFTQNSMQNIYIHVIMFPHQYEPALLQCYVIQMQIASWKSNPISKGMNKKSFIKQMPQLMLKFQPTLWNLGKRRPHEVKQPGFFTTANLQFFFLLRLHFPF